MENIPTLILIFGAAIVVSIIVFKDFITGDKKATKKPYFKWFIVIFLSIYQVGCWRGLASFGGAFGNQTGMQFYEFLFILVVIVWFLIQLASYND